MYIIPDSSHIVFLTRVDEKTTRFNQLATESDNNTFISAHRQAVVDKQLPDVDVGFISCLFATFTAIENLTVTELTENPPSPVSVLTAAYSMCQS